MNSFLPPLTAAEEKEYLQKYMEGDLEAKHILIERNLRLVAHVMKKYQNLNEDPEDLISIGTIGLIKAITTFDPTRNNRLAAYASKCIHNEILMMLRAKKKTSKDVSLYQSIGTDKEGNEISLLDILESSDGDIAEAMDFRKNLRRLYKIFDGTLTEREKRVLILRYGMFGGEEKTQREIAEKLHISRSYVSRIEKGALEKLKKRLDSEEVL